jgi:Proline-rich nuclear receptor coactivator motif
LNPKMSTNESATAALKGMLGISVGGAPRSSTPEKQDNVSNHQNDKKCNKKKRDNSAKKAKQKQPTNSTTNATTNKGSGAPPKNPTPNSTKKKHQPGNKPAAENFAWSAFQTSPDASALPLPEFISPVSPKPTIADQPLNTDKLSILLRAVSVRDSAAPEEIANAPRAEDFEAEVIAAAQKQAASEGRDETEVAQDEPRQKPEDEPVTSGGINLAALATSSSGASNSVNPTAMVVPELGPPSVALSQFNSPQHQRQQQFSSPLAHQQQQFIPPGYMAIQVQVPPHLMPGRVMVVHSPAGYPVQVVVPAGVPPGMVIPVLIPAPPAHMMPPPYPPQYSMQQTYNNNNNNNTMPSPHR